MIIAVSDLHLGDPVSNRVGFLSFIEEFLEPNSNEITDLVLLGDILDLWRRNSASVILENIDILNDVCSLGFAVHYIVGNHDFIMKEISQVRDSRMLSEGLAYSPNNMTVSDSQLLNNGGESYRFIHGHQMNYWYTLPFYEAFSQAMCEVNEEVKELSNVWKILRTHSGNLSRFASDKIMKWSEQEKAQIDRKLAGPLVGHSTTIEESIIEDYHLLGNLTEFKGKNSNQRRTIHEEILNLTSDTRKFSNIASLKALTEIGSDTSFEELAGNFLNAWIDTFQWLHSNKEVAERKELTTLARQIQRIASMFSTDLQRDEFLIHGHGHNSHVDHTYRMADTGCWIEDKASFISIKDGIVESSLWPKR